MEPECSRKTTPKRYVAATFSSSLIVFSSILPVRVANGSLQLGMEDGDTLEVHQEQIGGGC